MAMLLTNAGHTVSVERLVDAMWPDSSPPATCREQVKNCAAEVRRSLREMSGVDEADRSCCYEVALHTDAAGYRLEVCRCSIDAREFEDCLRAAVAGTPEDDAKARDKLATALRLWSGVPYGGLPAPELRAEASRLEELRLLATEELVARGLRMRTPPELYVAELVSLTQLYPLRERFVLLLMEALHRVGRSTEALARFHDYRRMLADEYGIEPGRDIRLRELQILNER